MQIERTRKVIQIAACERSGYLALFALCDDGALFLKHGEFAEWSEVKGVPQPEPKEITPTPEPTKGQGGFYGST